MVAIMDGPAGIPAAFRIAGFTTMMYDIVTNVVIPATTSRPKVVPDDLRENNFVTLGTAKDTFSVSPTPNELTMDCVLTCSRGRPNILRKRAPQHERPSPRSLQGPGADRHRWYGGSL